MYKKLSFWVHLSPFIISLIITIIIFVAFKFLPNRLPFFYSLPWGDSQLANSQQFLIIPASISLIMLFNLIISWQLHPAQSFFKHILLVSSITVTLILTVAFAKIILMFI